MYIKKLHIILLFVSLLTMSSCSEYNKVLNRGDVSAKYKLANELYQEGEYDKAIRLYEAVAYNFDSNAQKEVIVYRLGDSYFKTEDYVNAVYYFEKLINNFPNSTKLGEVQFAKAESYYQLSPKFSIDQKDTQNAIDAFQIFIDGNGDDAEQVKIANKRIKELNYKLETKAFKIANQYYKIGYYKSAVRAFDNLIFDHLGTKYKEQAMALKFKASYELAINSITHKKADRIDIAVKHFERFKKTFPNSKELAETEKLYNRLIKEKHTLS